MYTTKLLIYRYEIAQEILNIFLRCIPIQDSDAIILGMTPKLDNHPTKH